MPGFNTYVAEGLQEDVQDDIHMISPADTPVQSMSRGIRAEARLHEFQEDELAAIRKNAAVEGADAGADTSTATNMVTVSTQIFEEVAQITRTQERVLKYGRSSEMSYQLSKRYLQIGRDKENAIVGDAGGTGRQTGNAGGASTARELTSIHNMVNAANIVDATAATTTADLEASLLEGHRLAFDAGADCNYLFCGSLVAGYVPSFALSAGREREVRETELIHAIDLYQDQFGRLDVVTNRSQVDSVNTMIGIDMDYSATPILDATHDYEIAKLGDSDRRQVIHEGTYALLNSKAAFIVDNISGSLTPPS